MSVEQGLRPISARYLRRVRFRPFYFACIIIFFIVGTPFELYQSGFGYSIKLAGLAFLFFFAVFLGHARISTLPVIPLIIILLTLILNTFGEYTDRGLIAVSVMMLSLLLGLSRSPKWDHDFTFIVRAYLIIHFVALVYVLLVFSIFSVVADPHGSVFPHEARAIVHGSFARLSGLHNEPGTYAQWTIAALFLYALCSGRLSSSFNIVVVSSILFTLSVWAYGAFALFLSSVIVLGLMSVRLGVRQFFHAWSAIFVLVSVPVASIFLLPDYIFSDIVFFFETKLSFETESGFSKVDTVNYLLLNMEDVIFVGEPLYPGLCPSCVSPQDAGLAVNAIYYFGLIPALLLFAHFGVFVFRKGGVTLVSFSLILLSWKANFYEPLFWIIIGHALSAPSRNISFPESGGLSRREINSERSKSRLSANI